MIDRTVTATIMVVDDTTANLKLLQDTLQTAGYRVMVFPSGRLALAAAARNPPDLVLLDISMPDMDGFEVCDRLKADAATKDIPVLFISALSEISDKVKAFAHGGVDYVTKPFQFEEVHARIQTHLALRRQQMQLQEAFRKLQELETLRDNLTHMIVHDLRSPLTGISGYLRLLTTRLNKNATDPKLLEFVTKATHSANTLIEMICSLLDVNRMEEGKMPLKLRHYDLNKLSREAIESLGAIINECSINVEMSSDVPQLYCDTDLIRRVLANLLANAIKFSPEKGQITLAASAEGNTIRVSIKDNGPGIPPEYHTKIFEKFGQVELRREDKMYSSGIGLTFCKLAIEAHDGTIGVESAPGKGSTFWFTIAKQ